MTEITKEEQLELWRRGKSVHAGECCPDFSCCEPNLLFSAADREKFCKAHKEKDELTTNYMLAAALSNMLANAGAKVHIAGVVHV